ncbi:hypothetical protein [Streptomyces sp. SID4982]|uniref:hypothetical protein n=1 Tax=Streptomyces sp. SID4982 TaxID=2690291 RepID=UPI001368460F|nr:hypothetical protein [Streptomyces sp. SID4982]MYS18347.1 hypothetical protein [Streptomyces sp. SID4982]
MLSDVSRGELAGVLGPVTVPKNVPSCFFCSFILDSHGDEVPQDALLNQRVCGAVAGVQKADQDVLDLGRSCLSCVQVFEHVRDGVWKADEVVQAPADGAIISNHAELAENETNLVAVEPTLFGDLFEVGCEILASAWAPTADGASERVMTNVSFAFAGVLRIENGGLAGRDGEPPGAQLAVHAEEKITQFAPVGMEDLDVVGVAQEPDAVLG